MKYNIRENQIKKTSSNKTLVSKYQTPPGPLQYKPKSKISTGWVNELPENPYDLKTLLTNGQMQPSVEVIKKFEKFKPKVYLDGNGKPTIGYGSTAPEYINKKELSEPEAAQAVVNYITTNINPILQKQPYYNKLGPNQRAALTSLIYNIGPTQFRNSPKLQKALTTWDINNIIKNMDHGMSDTKNGGLKTRRLFEQQLFLSDLPKH